MFKYPKSTKKSGHAIRYGQHVIEPSLKDRPRYNNITYTSIYLHAHIYILQVLSVIYLIMVHVKYYLSLGIVLP